MGGRRGEGGEVCVGVWVLSVSKLPSTCDWLPLNLKDFKI